MARRKTPGLSGQNLTKKERREQALSKARAMQQAERRRARRNRIFMILGSFVVVALVVAAVFVIVRSSKEKGEFAHGTKVITETRPKNVTEWGGVNVGKGADGKLTAGVVNEGKPTVAVYYDYLCHACNTLESTKGRELLKRAEKGEITLVYQPVSVIGGEFSAKAAQADYYVAANAPDKYTQFHSTFFSDISDAAIKNQQVPSVSEITKVAQKVGLSSEQVAGLEETLSKNGYAKLVSQADEQFREDGLTGTPAIILEGKRKLDNWAGNSLKKALDDLS